MDYNDNYICGECRVMSIMWGIEPTVSNPLPKTEARPLRVNDLVRRITSKGTIDVFRVTKVSPPGSTYLFETEGEYAAYDLSQLHPLFKPDSTRSRWEHADGSQIAMLYY